MLSHRAKIRRHLRSARVSALTPEERLDALREAERRISQGGGRTEPATPDDTQGPDAEPHGNPS